MKKLIDVHIDCEFVPYDLTLSGLITISVVTPKDSYYAVNADMTRFAGEREWMRDNVLHHIPGEYVLMGASFIPDFRNPDVKRYEVIAKELGEFFRSVCDPFEDADDAIRLWALCGAQDIMRLHSLWDNDWKRMPKWIPRYFDDVRRLVIDSGMDENDLPQQDPARQHHALYDAQHQMEVVNFIKQQMGI